MKKLCQANLVFVLILFLAAVALSVIAYPELFLYFKTSVIVWPDYDVEYAPVFALTSFFYQGGIQLWDFFSQMPYVYAFTALGILKFPSLVTAGLYWVLHPFSHNSAALFYHVFIWGYMMVLLGLRVVGIFLLLNAVTKNKILLGISTLLFAVFFSQPAFIRGTFYMSFFPLGMYFILRFFQSLKERFLLASLSFMVVILGNEVIHGSYFYVPMHFFIISGILWRFLISPPSKALWTNWGKIFDRKIGIALVILVSLLIMGPYIYMIKFWLHDVVFDQANSRVGHMFSPGWYFHHLDLDLGNPRDFFAGIIRIQFPVIPGDMPYYLGISFLFLALAGLVLSSNQVRIFFGLTIMFLWLLSFPREGLNPGTIVHWINALTDPLKSLPRAYRYATNSMLPYLMMPLAVLGIESLTEFYKGHQYAGFKLRLLGALILVMGINAFGSLTAAGKLYLIIAEALMLGALLLVCVKNSLLSRRFFISVISILVLVDIFFIIQQTKSVLQFFQRKADVLDAAPLAGLVDYNDANPSIFPYRYSSSQYFSYHDESIIWQPHGVTPDLQHTVNQALNFCFLNGYNPRHKSFLNWMDDPAIVAYLKQNNQFMFLAPTAINSSPVALSRICSVGLSHQVVSVDDPARELKLPNQWPQGIVPQPTEHLQYEQILGTVDNSQGAEDHAQGGMAIYTWHLAHILPDHLASSWFYPESQYLRFFVKGGTSWRELQETQGELIRPYTFEVSNIQQGDLHAAFPKDVFPLGRACSLYYPSPAAQGVERIWRKQFDHWGFIYRAKSSGWLVIHEPYDTKWQIMVDGKKVQYYRANESFIGFYLDQGEHKILIEYWPNTPLRFFLLLSVIMTSASLLVLIFLGLKWEEH